MNKDLIPECFNIPNGNKNILYVTKEFIAIHFDVTVSTVETWSSKSKQENPLKTYKKPQTRKNLYIIKEVEEWREKNIDKKQSKRATKNNEDEEVDEEVDIEKLFKLTPEEKTKYLAKFSSAIIEKYKMLEEYAQKAHKNVEFSKDYIHRKEPEKAQRTLLIMFISLLRNAINEMPKNLENLSQQEIYNYMDVYWDNEINKLSKLLKEKNDLTFTDIMYEIKEKLLEGIDLIEIKNTIKNISA